MTQRFQLQDASIQYGLGPGHEFSLVLAVFEGIRVNSSGIPDAKSSPSLAGE